MRAKGIDNETLSSVTEQLRIERHEADAAAARLFFASGDKIMPTEFSDQLSDARRRCSGVLAAAMGVIDVSCDSELSGGLIQLIDDLLNHLTRLDRAFSAEITQEWMEARAKGRCLPMVAVPTRRPFSATPDVLNWLAEGADKAKVSYANGINALVILC